MFSRTCHSTKGFNSLKDQADVVARAHCCTDCCLLSKLGYDEAKKVVLCCLTSRENMTRVEKKNDLRAIVKECIVTTSKETGYSKMKWVVGDKMKICAENVCKRAFCNAYHVSPSHVDNVMREIKNGLFQTMKTLSDRSSVDHALLPQLRQLAKRYGLVLTRTQVAAAKLPNSPTVLMAYGWMADHFDLIGDMAPNRDGEIHLEPCHIVEVHAEHKLDMSIAGMPCVSVDTFASIWANCFEHVKIREFKAVTGKCSCCATLSSLRRTFKSHKDREYVTMMHALHRSTYMGERMAYASRRNKAVMQRSRYLSTISDGMAQSHNVLPHFGNQDQWKEGTLPQHLQGILNHNRGMNVYRTFHTVNNCANVAMYTFLDTLQQVIDEEGKLPDTVYHQIDGGSENTAYCWFALCELIVARRLCSKLVLTRLPVGHTHEDIDSKFGILWKRIRNKYVHTPQQYKSLIVDALSSKNHHCKVMDVFAVPDFKSLLDPLLDPKLNACTKLEKTQLQWTFEAVTPDKYFTNGVQVFYRAFSAEEVVQIIEDDSKQCGVFAKQCDVFDYPMKDIDKGILVDGMTILTGLPAERPAPMPFVPGSRELLDSVVAKIQRKFHHSHKNVVQQWLDWARDVAPSSDSVEEYLEKQSLSCPLGDVLFGDSPIDCSVVPCSADGIPANLQRMRTTDCVKWSRWGHKREDYSVENFARVEYGADARNLINALPPPVVRFRQWKKRRTLKEDEVGDFKFILSRADQRNINSPFAHEGQAIELRSGGHRVYWKDKKIVDVFPGNDDPDHSLKAKMKVGWYSYGRIEPPPGGVGIVGVVKLHDGHGCLVAGEVHPLSPHCKKRKRKEKIDMDEEEDVKEESEEEEGVREEKSDEEEEESDNDSDDENAVQLYKVGDRIRNRHNLHGVVTDFRKGRYDVVYNDGRVDLNLKESILRPPVVRSGAKKKNAGTWEMKKVAAEPWVDRGGVISANIIDGSRRS